ncbi:GH32 C-terminal domain-containing protein, partial [Erwinia amylovora]|uniref:GH32 C-terminal domain-containing protein n=1 Tax=Erwinia amylovora TaxID=552 RepID=UPI0020BE7EE1
RNNLRSGDVEERYWMGEVRTWRSLCDSSSIEIFINDGEGVMASRYFPAAEPRLRFSGSAQIALRYWRLQHCVIE